MCECMTCGRSKYDKEPNDQFNQLMQEKRLGMETSPFTGMKVFTPVPKTSRLYREVPIGNRCNYCDLDTLQTFAKDYNPDSYAVNRVLEIESGVNTPSQLLAASQPETFRKVREG